MATICMICEGAYPYIVGGVSSWIHQIISSNPEHNFKLLCIIPNEEFAKLKYELPKNVVEVKNLNLNPHLKYSPWKITKNKFFSNEERKKKIEALMDFDVENCQERVCYLNEVFEKGDETPLEIILSKDYWNILVKNYQEKYSENNFNLYYWTYRNIMMNLIQISQSTIPSADIYHAVSTGYAGYLGALAVHRNQGKLLLTEHGIYPREREEEVLGAEWIDKKFKNVWIDYFYYLSKLTYKFCDIVVSLFEYNRQLQIKFGADEKNSIVIPNGVDVENFSNIERVKKEGFNIGSVLRVVPIKDVKMMIKGFKIALNKIPEAKLWLIGPDDENEEYYEECVELVKNLGLEEKVVFTGRTDVKEYYSFLDILLLTSISEGQPLSLLEGMAVGIPCISTDVGNCREMLTGWKEVGEAGVIIPPTSYTDLGKEIVKLYFNREKLEEFGKNGAEIVKRYYQKSDCIEKYKELYRKLGEEEWQE